MHAGGVQKRKRMCESLDLDAEDVVNRDLIALGQTLKFVEGQAAILELDVENELLGETRIGLHLGVTVAVGRA